MAFLVNFDFIRRDGKRVRGTTLYKRIEQRDSQPDFPGARIQCDLDRVEVIVTSDDEFAPEVYWSFDVFGPDGNAELMREPRDGEPLDIALVKIREGQVWVVRAEPTLDNQIGIAICNAKGKTLFTGIGNLTPVQYVPLREGLEPKAGTAFTFFFREVYSWAWSSPIGCATTSGADRVNSPAIYPDYGAPDGGIPDAGR
jgi:hypothetical protein